MRERGLTLVELMVTVVVIVILATVGAPNLSRFLDNARAASTANSLLGSLQLARSNAIRFASTQQQGTYTVARNTQVTGSAATFGPTGSVIVDPAASYSLTYVITSGSASRCIELTISGSAEVIPCAN